MIVSVYHEVIQFVEIGGDMVERLKQSKLYLLFKDLEQAFQPSAVEILENNKGFDGEGFNKALFYTMYCYSKESNYLQLGVDWAAIKQNICIELDIEEETEFYNKVVLLQDKNVVACVHKYLTYQGSQKWATLLMLKDLQHQMASSAVSSIYKSSGEVDYDQKMKNSKYVIELQDKIEEWERKVADDMPRLKEALNEIKERSTTDKLSLRVESLL